MIEMSLPDLAYLVHEADNELLRYSLRSIDRYAQGMFDRIWIVGVLPGWIRGVEHIECVEPGEKFASIRAKIEALCADDRVASKVVILNDDYIALETVTSWEPKHMGPTSVYLAEEAKRGRTPSGNTWIRAVSNTAAWMTREYGDIDCYEGHVPLLFNRAALGSVVGEYPRDRSCDYPGFYPTAGACGPGSRAVNAKIGPSPGEFHDKINRLPGWLSTNDRGFGEGMVGGFIRGMLREPSRYER